MKKLLIILILILSCGTAWGACSAVTGDGSAGSPYTYTAADASTTEVQACDTAIDAAAHSGYVTLNIPAGAADWEDDVLFDGNAAGYHNVTNLVIQGAGNTSTVITNKTSGVVGDYAPIALYINHSTQHFTVKNIGFTEGAGIGSSASHIYINGYQNPGHQGYRITGCAFADTTGMVQVSKVGNIYGLIDNNTFTSVAGRAISLVGSGSTAWGETLTFGTANAGNAQYVENNTFTFTGGGDGAVDTYNGEKAVIRYNTINGTHLANLHGYDSGGYRSTFSVEIYNNSMDDDYVAAFAMRGGSGIFYSNTVSGSYGKFGIHEYYRSRPDFYGTHTGNGTDCTDNCATLVDTAVTTNCHASGFDGTADKDSTYPPYCSGARTVSNSLYLCNQTKQKCKQVTGHTATTISATWDSADDYWDVGDVYAVFYFNHTACDGLSDSEDGAGTYGYPCKDQPGRTTDQETFGIFQWNNTYGGAEASWTANTISFFESQNVQVDRDVFNREPQSGDDGWVYYSGYSRYTCPHPLVDAAGAYACDESVRGASAVDGVGYWKLKGGGGTPGSGPVWTLGTGAVATFQ